MKKRILIKNYARNLFDIYGNILIKADENITTTLIKSITRNATSRESQIILAKTPIVKDILTAVSTGIYRTIFSNKEDLTPILKIVAKTKLKAPIIEELKSLKKCLPLVYNHLLIVTALSIKMSLDLKNYDPFQAAQIGLVHDLGKSRLPQDILEKRGPLTHDEFKMIQTHPSIEYILLSAYLKNTKSTIAYTSFLHHERSDGTGYPRGIQRLNKYVQTLIPCDIFDALVSSRPYRSGPYTARAALDLLLDEVKKGRLNKKFVICLISYMRREKINFKNVKIATQHRDAPPLINYYGIRIA